MCVPEEVYDDADIDAPKQKLKLKPSAYTYIIPRFQAVFFPHSISHSDSTVLFLGPYSVPGFLVDIPSNSLIKLSNTETPTYSFLAWYLHDEFPLNSITLW